MIMMMMKMLTAVDILTYLLTSLQKKMETRKSLIKNGVIKMVENALTFSFSE